MRRLLLMALALLTAAAQAQDTAKLDHLLGALDREGLALGSVAVASGERAPYLRSLGAARLEGPAPQPANAETRYRIGSVSKLFTASLVMQLVDEGRLTLDAPLARWYPQFPQAQQTTVAHLLGHRGGGADMRDLPDFNAERAFQPQREAQLLKDLAVLPPHFAPGTRSEYNNAGYLLLTFIVQRVTGLPYGEVLAARITSPLGLKDTVFDAKPTQHPADARSYVWDGRWRVQRATDPSVPLGSGGIVSTPRDLAVFIRALFKGSVVSVASLARMQTATDGLGLGLHPNPGLGGTAWGHEGLIDGYTATLAYFPQTDTALAWCANGLALQRDDLVKQLRAALFDAAYTPPSFANIQAVVDFGVDLGPNLGPKTAAVSVRGNALPLSWQRNTPLQRDPATGLWRGRVTLQARDGLPVEFKYLTGDEGWEHTPNRELRPRAGQPTTLSDRWDHDAARLALYETLLAQDKRFFDAFNERRLDELATMFSPQLEFFHDRSGITGYAENMAAMKSNFSRADAPRRTLVPGSSEVFPAGANAAMHLGRHRFCNGPVDRPACSEYRFVNIWQRSAAGWQLYRVVSVDH